MDNTIPPGCLTITPIRYVDFSPRYFILPDRSSDLRLFCLVFHFVWASCQFDHDQLNILLLMNFQISTCLFFFDLQLSLLSVCVRPCTSTAFSLLVIIFRSRQLSIYDDNKNESTHWYQQTNSRPQSTFSLSLPSMSSISGSSRCSLDMGDDRMIDTLTSWSFAVESNRLAIDQYLSVCEMMTGIMEQAKV